MARLLTMNSDDFTDKGYNRRGKFSSINDDAYNYKASFSYCCVIEYDILGQQRFLIGIEMSLETFRLVVMEAGPDLKSSFLFIDFLFGTSLCFSHHFHKNVKITAMSNFIPLVKA